MNSAYGKTILNAIETQITYVNNDDINKYVLRNYEWIKEFQQAADQKKYRVSKYKAIVNHYNNCQVGVEILSMSKRIMNEVICLAEDKGLKIYYQDTDSLHIEDKHISVLADEFKKMYGRDLIGKGMSQFHSDFELDNCKDVYAERSYFLGKKCYLDCLVGINKNTGKLERGHHIRLKGIPIKSIYYKCMQDGITIEYMYKRLYEGEQVEFDLLCGGNSVSFQFNKNLTISNRQKMIRKVKF